MTALKPQQPALYSNLLRFVFYHFSGAVQRRPEVVPAPSQSEIQDATALLPDPAEAPCQPAPFMEELGQDLQAGDGVFKKPRNGGINGELRKQVDRGLRGR